MTSPAQARTPRYPEWRDTYEIVAEVTRAEHCANFIKIGETFVFDLEGRILSEKSTAALCLGMLARIHSGLLMAVDRAALGVHPISPAWNTFDCFDTGVEHGGMGKVCVRLYLREAATGRIVEDAAADV